MEIKLSSMSTFDFISKILELKYIIIVALNTFEFRKSYPLPLIRDPIPPLSIP